MTPGQAGGLQTRRGQTLLAWRRQALLAPAAPGAHRDERLELPR
jgi:hypothetical protein